MTSLQAMPSLLPALPEITLLVMICVILLVDVFSGAANKVLVYILSQATLVVTAVMTWRHLDLNAVTFHHQFILDPMASVLKLFMLILTFGVFMYSRGYVSKHRILSGEFHILALLSLLGGMVLVSAYSMLTLYIGLELLSLPLYVLVALHFNPRVGSEAAMKYFVMGAVASGFLLFGISLIYGVSGSFMLPTIAQHLSEASLHNPVWLFGLVFIVAGLAFKFGAVPFHMWVPDVYEGSASSSTVFIATVPKLAGFGMLIRLLVNALPSLYGHWHILLLILAVLSLVLGNVLAVVQRNVKRMLAYSTIAHMSFILFAVALGDKAGFSAGLFYSIVYALMALGGFGMLLLLSQAGTEIERVEDLAGLNSRHPWFAFIMLLLMLSMAGIPPLIGFDAKLWVLMGLINAGHYYLAGFALIMSVVGAYYYLRVVKAMYFDDAPEVKETPMPLDGRVAVSINGVALLVLGCVPAALFALCHIPM